MTARDGTAQPVRQPCERCILLRINLQSLVSSDEGGLVFFSIFLLIFRGMQLFAAYTDLHAWPGRH